jgi:hypothetical protein
MGIYLSSLETILLDPFKFSADRSYPFHFATPTCSASPLLSLTYLGLPPLNLKILLSVESRLSCPLTYYIRFRPSYIYIRIHTVVVIDSLFLVVKYHIISPPPLCLR